METVDNRYLKENNQSKSVEVKAVHYDPVWTAFLSYVHTTSLFERFTKSFNVHLFTFLV